MTTTRTRLATLAAICAATLSFTAAGPAVASYESSAGPVPIDTLVAGEDASTDKTRHD